MGPTEKLLRELIARPSVNPAFAPDDRAATGEKRVAEFLAQAGRRAGLAVEWQKVFPDRANLLLRLSPREKVQRRILLAPHLDTVGVADAGQWRPRREGGRLFGRGACDTKGSVAAMFTALIRLARGGRRAPGTEIIFAGLVDEENGQGGSRALATGGLKADLAIVGEPTKLRVVTAHKGDLWLRLETRGKAAHGARPELGRNAVHEMARIVDLLETDYARSLSRRKHRLLGRATINVGSIAGGRQPNIVPDSCVISADRRTLPGETEAGVRREIRDLLRRHGLRATIVDSKNAPCLPMETAATLPLVRQFFRAGGQSGPAGVDFFCDASILAQGGIPSVVFGPGDIAQAHTVNEWIEVRQLEQSTAILENFLRTVQ